MAQKSLISESWHASDTLLLDMDGTLLDLSFDNWFWHEAVPRCLTRLRGAAAAEVRAMLLESYARMQGTLQWYCLDYWTAELEIDLRALKAASSHRIRFLPGAREFLYQARASGKRMVLVTNAHADTLRVKNGVCGLAGFFEVCISSHEFGVPKEAPEFWPLLQKRLGFTPQRTLFVDDSQSVLDAASGYGIGAVVGISRPDSRQPVREAQGHHAIERVADLIR